MQEHGHLSSEHPAIAGNVKKKYAKLRDSIITHNISPEEVNTRIAKLKRNSSPGIDSITAEFLIYGRSNILCQQLSAFYLKILTNNCVPSVLFSTGVLVPILKKAALDPSFPSNYRPITISALFLKLFEVLIFPTDVALCDNQFGLRADYSVMCYCNVLL